MANPWDTPPFPTKGDFEIDLTYAGVGQFMSQWEGVEFILSRIYGVFVGKPNYLGSILEYGSGNIFRERYRILCTAADAYFVSQPHQENEGFFQHHVELVRNYSNRRNEIAHGTVMPIDEFTFFSRHLEPEYAGITQFALIPPLYSVRHYDTNNLPKYAYVRETLLQLEARLHELRYELHEYRDRIDPT